MSKETVCLNIEGMSIEEAKKYARQKGYELRVKEKNGVPNFITSDYRTDRITVKINNDKIEEAEIS